MRGRVDGFRLIGTGADGVGHGCGHRHGQINRHNKSNFEVDGVLQARVMRTVHPVQGGSQLDERHAVEVCFIVL